MIISSLPINCHKYLLGKNETIIFQLRIFQSFKRPYCAQMNNELAYLLQSLSETTAFKLPGVDPTIITTFAESVRYLIKDADAVSANLGEEIQALIQEQNKIERMAPTGRVNSNNPGYDKVYEEMVKFAARAEQKLKDLRIPLFCLRPGVVSNQLIAAEKRKLLDFLMDYYGS